MAGQKRIRYQWILHQLEKSLRDSFYGISPTVPEGTSLYWVRLTEGNILEEIDRLKHSEYERVFNEEAYENKTKGSNARKGHK